MSDKKDKIFPQGMFLAEPNEGAPDFVKGNLSIKVAEFTQFLNLHQNNAGYVNLDLKESIGGRLYLELNQWQPKKEAPKETGQGEVPTEVDYPEESNEEIPF